MSSHIAHFITLAVVVFLSACSVPSAQKNRITVTIEPQRYFAQLLVDSLFEIDVMVPPGVSPESYDPSPRQMTRLAQSKAYFLIGNVGFENAWLDRLKKNNPQVRFFNNSQNVSLFHNDPHVWTSPFEVRQIVYNMFHALTELDPTHTDIYHRNLVKLLAKIESADQTLRAALSHSLQRAFIIYHPALTYLAHGYGLTQYAIETDGKEPSPERLKQLIDTARMRGVRTVFIQQEFDQKNARIIAREIGARLIIINPLSFNWSEEIVRIANALSE